MENKVFTLKEISQWTQKGSKVMIPAIQRGLVWKPRQVELLWDSILRGFPIGSFMLSDTKDNPNQYHLIDGQQRFNAISLGYNSEPNPRAVLWLDIAPKFPSSSSRSFLVRVTTSAHPWGYGKDDQCIPLKTEERRKALSLYNLQGSIYNQNFSLTQTWPWLASKPIPLSIITSATLESSEKFSADILYRLSQSPFAIKDILIFDDDDKRYICESLYPSMLSIDKNYHVHCNHLPLSVIEKNDNNIGIDVENKSNLEILFERINVNGTKISNDDLNYSSIKAYWKDIRDINDSLAARYMRPSKLAMLVFRLCTTNLWAEKLQDNISLARIRKLSLETDKTKCITFFYENELEQVLNQIDEWLGVNQEGELRTPAILRTVIAHKSTQLYLLLMYWAKISIEHPECVDLSSEQVRAIAFTIRWFHNNEDAIILAMMKRTSKEQKINMPIIQQVLSRSMHDCHLLHIYTPDELSKFFEIGNSPQWTPYNQNSGPWKEFFERISAGYGYDLVQEMLLYAERGYINTHFSNYDPARLDMWESYNRPWDFDHIIAQNRINNKRGKYRKYDQFWLNTIGNIGAISYETNRSKHDSMSEYCEYQSNKEYLLYDEHVEELDKFDITVSSKQSFTFASTSFNRLIRIYRSVYEVIFPALDKMAMSETLNERRKLFEDIKSSIPDAKIYFVAGNNDEYEIVREQDWCREWISIGITTRNFCASFVWDARKRNFYPEIGIRKAPGTKMNHDFRTQISKLDNLNAYDKGQNDWWYAINILNEINVEAIISELKRLFLIIEQLDKII